MTIKVRRTSTIPPGERIEWRIASAQYDPEGRFGPEIGMRLEALRPEQYRGMQIFENGGFSRPRTDKVSRMRSDGLDDESIAKALRKKGFQFADLDEQEEPELSDGGKNWKIAMAGFKNAVERIFDCKSFEELASEMEGTEFSAVTRKSGDWTRIDWETVDLTDKAKEELGFPARQEELEDETVSQMEEAERRASGRDQDAEDRDNPLFDSDSEDPKERGGSGGKKKKGSAAGDG